MKEIKPHEEIYYFAVGNSPELRLHSLKRSSDTAGGLDSDSRFHVYGNCRK
jgi:hypothetical protein